MAIIDPFHRHFSAYNLSFFIFSLTYLPVIVFLLFHVTNIRVLNHVALAYCFIVVTRMAAIYFLPLCEPAGAIPLDDSVLNTVFYPRGYCGQDLFYSGHTATLFLLSRMSKRIWKNVLVVLSILLGTMLVLQKVHYTIDIAAAFPFAWMCWWASAKFLQRISSET